MRLFISFEGIDGCGKTTQIQLLSDKLQSSNINNIIIREPGGTVSSNKIRQILLDKKNHISSESETFLFLSARAQLVHEVIKPALNQNITIICDRFIDSTVAYQGYGRKLNIDLIRKFNSFATDSICPDITFILDLDPKISVNRLNSSNLDRIEKSGIKFMKDISDGYKEISKTDTNKYKLIDCNDKDILTIHHEIVDILKLRYGKDLK